jgi:N-acetylglutamate synthase (N-acetylornithine aminotransferase)
MGVISHPTFIFVKIYAMEILMGVGKGGLKAGNKPDILVILLPHPCTASFLFTTNHFKSASVIYSEKVLRERDTIRALVINSGNANCGVGEEGIIHAEMMARETAKHLDIDYKRFLFFPLEL